MKKLFYSLIAFALPISAFAQIPVLDSAEFYHVGQHFHYMLCSPTAAGPAGAMQSWDFTSIADSALVPVDVLAAVNPDTSTVTIDYAGTIYHLTISDTQTVLGELELPIADITYTPPILLAPHPVTYLDHAAGAFTNVSNSPSTGAGTWTLDADGYGTLKTPQATFNNSLRIKSIRSEDDTTGFGVEHVDFVSYLWYDSSHVYPLMRVDSVIGTGVFPMTQITVAYFTTDTPTAVRQINKAEVAGNAHLDNNGLVLKANLAQGHEYRMGILSLNGKVVYGTTFTASGNLERFNFDNKLPLSTYFISISDLNSQAPPITIKVMKQ